MNLSGVFVVGCFRTYAQVHFVVRLTSLVLAGRAGSAGSLPDRLAAPSTVPRRGRRGGRRATACLGGGNAAIASGASGSLDCAPSGNQLDAEDGDRDNQQYVNETTQRVRRHQTEHP